MVYTEISYTINRMLIKVLSLVKLSKIKKNTNTTHLRIQQVRDITYIYTPTTYADFFLFFTKYIYEIHYYRPPN